MAGTADAVHLRRLPIPGPGVPLPSTPRVLQALQLAVEIRRRQARLR